MANIQNKCDIPKLSKKKAPMSIKAHLDVLKIDSLRVRVPIQLVEFLDKELYNEFAKFNTKTGEILTKKDEKTGEYLIDTHVVTRKYKVDKGIGISYRIDEVMTGAGGKKQKFLFIGCSSKMLKENYFEGLNKKNIKKVWDRIIEEGIVKLRLGDFLSSKVTDIDFCEDIYVLDKLKEIQEVKERMHAKQIVKMWATATRAKYSGSSVVQTFLKKDNIGIQFRERDKIGRSYKTKPFLKLYAKLIELTYHSKDFKEEYLNTPELKEFKMQYFMRMEATIKNGAHFKAYGIENIKTLNDLLHLDLNKYRDPILQHPINLYMDALKRQQLPKQEGFSLRDRFTRKLLETEFQRQLREAYCEFKEEDLKSNKGQCIREIMATRAVDNVVSANPDESERRARKRLVQYLHKLIRNISNFEFKKYENKNIDMLEKLSYASS